MDIQTAWKDMACDWVIAPPGLAEDDGLHTAVILSLFTDAQADAGDVLPGDPDDRRGWWADTFADIEGDRIGSKLWLLSREKQMASVVERARQYATDALAWLIADGIARTVEVVGLIPRPGVLGLEITISRADGESSRFRFDSFWKAA